MVKVNRRRGSAKNLNRPGMLQLIYPLFNCRSRCRRESWFGFILGSQTFWFELSLPVVQRRIPAGLAQMPKPLLRRFSRLRYTVHIVFSFGGDYRAPMDHSGSSELQANSDGNPHGRRIGGGDEFGPQMGADGGRWCQM